ncbi:MAG: putative relaxase [Hydrocarboniphaga sp.]|uniref:relaxase/mobilization nuclease domain-containing protein n=1 Tax=Hydrocarboniphaga sp. TaxID=2033016 RepID=UPI00262D147E|nr:relaxase/mobilization nuclease domain-containing protein [Hydrocarboniphaga sp.]MDB5968515.1 putative relaxase [Hydrocarboniphaga sp.]
MAGPERRDGDGLLDEQPHGRKAKAGRLIGPGGPYRRPGGGGAALARNLRIAQRRPQAILKITRYGHGGNKIMGHIHYVRRHGRLTLEDENGDKVEDIRELRRRVQSWTEQAGARMEEPGADRQRKRRVTAHFILDAGAQAKPESLSKAARQFLSERFGKDGHEYLLVRHDDTKQPHVHVVLNLMNGQGKRLHTSVAEVQRWRERFAEIAREHGIDVDATRAWERGKAPARSRGLVRHGAPKPAHWTREQVRRGLEARKQRLLSESTLAAVDGDHKRAAALKAKAASLRMRTDDKLVRHTAAERRTDVPSTPWEAARIRNAREVAQGFRDQSDSLLVEARASDDEPRRQMLERAAILLRVLAHETQPTPTRAQQVASQMQRTPAQNKAADPDRER